MNRRELLAASAAGVASLLVPSVAVAKPKYETLREYILRTLPSQPDVCTFYQFWRINRKYDRTKRQRAEELPSGYIAHCRRSVMESANLNRFNEPWCIMTEKGWHKVHPITQELIPYDPLKRTSPPV